MRALFLPLAGALSVFWVSGALAVEDSTTTFTASTSEEIVLNTAQVTTSNTITSYLTQIIGRLNGGTVFNQSYPLSYANPIVQAGQTSAILAITTAGGPGVVIGTPVLTATSQSLTSSNSVTTYGLVDTNRSVQSTVNVGPDSVLTGQRTVCLGVSTLPSTVAPSCAAGAATNFIVVSGTTNVNTNINTAYTIDQATLITNNYELFEQYTISGTVQALGGAHAAVPSALGDENERFTRRLIGDAVQAGAIVEEQGDGDGPSTAMGWANGYGWSGSGNGDKRSAVGLEGGLGVDVSDTLRLGFGVSHGWVNLDLDNAGGSADAQLTELGLYGAWRNNGFYASLAGVAGFGSVETAGLGSTAAYDAKLFSLAGEAGYDAMVNGWQITPHFGGQWTSVSTGAFTETGPFALTSAGSNTGFGKVWLGLNAERKFDTWTLSGHARVIAYGDDNTTLPVSFTGSSALMALKSANHGTFGAEAGIAAHVQLSTAVSAFGSYDLKLRDGGTTHTGMLGLKMKW